jgi:hypothetical protein
MSPHEQDLELSPNPKGSIEQQKLKWRKNSNKNVCKLAKFSNFHGKSNTTP